MGNIFLGADHSGFKVKDQIRDYLIGKEYEVVDFGTNSSAPVHYPIFARRVAEHVQETGDLGVLLCGSGIGMSIAVNRFEGIYAARCVSVREAETAKRTGANVLCLGSKSSSPEEAIAMVDAFIETEFSREKRHLDRLALIDRLAKRSTR